MKRNEEASRDWSGGCGGGRAGRKPGEIPLMASSPGAKAPEGIFKTGRALGLRWDFWPLFWSGVLLKSRCWFSGNLPVFKLFYFRHCSFEHSL